jgi:uncharacterized phage protein gp47/JayE
MQLSLLNKDQVTANMAAAVQAQASAFGFTISVAPGSIVLAILESVAGMFLWLQWLNVLVLQTARLTTSSGADVDSFCNGDFGCPRLPGTAASGPVTFGRYSTTNIAYIPVGTSLKTTDGSQSFTVLADATNAAWVVPNTTYPSGAFMIAAGTANLTCTAQNTIVGTAGNVLANTIALISTVINGVDTVTNAAAFTNGANAETDAAYKIRFGLFLIGLQKSTMAAVESAVLAVSQNLTCAVLNNCQAIGGSFAASYFVVAVDDGSGATPSGTINACAAAVAATQGLGAMGYVVQATPVFATVALTITCATAATKTATTSLVQAAIASYIGALPVATVPPSGAPANSYLSYGKLFSLAFGASANVLDVTAVTLNGGTADIGGAPGTVVRLSSVTVS